MFLTSMVCCWLGEKLQLCCCRWAPKPLARASDLVTWSDQTQSLHRAAEGEYYCLDLVTWGIRKIKWADEVCRLGLVLLMTGQRAGTSVYCPVCPLLQQSSPILDCEWLGSPYKQVTNIVLKCAWRGEQEGTLWLLFGSVPLSGQGGHFCSVTSLTAPTRALDGAGALTAPGHCVRAESIKATPPQPLPSLICSHSWGQNTGFNQQLLLAPVQMLPVGIGFSSGPTSCFNGLVKAWKSGVEAGWVCLLVHILHQLHTVV